ncbi:MAG TPA: diversity-generating retroelement protein Avd [Anaerolineaceae bacterium]
MPSTSPAQTPIFTRTYDFLTWLLPATNHFPRAHRFTLTQRLLNAAFDLREHLEAANHRMGADRLALLKQADADLDRVRLYLRLAAGWGWLNPGQYQHVAGMVAEIGRLLIFPSQSHFPKKEGLNVTVINSH